MSQEKMCINCGKPIHHSLVQGRWEHDGVLLNAEWCGREMGSGTIDCGDDISGTLAVPIDAAKLAELKRLAAASLAYSPYLNEHERGLKLSDILEERLTIVYEEDGAWRINYRHPNGSVTPVNNRMRAEQARAQIRGIAHDFAESVQNSNSKAIPRFGDSQ